MRLARGTDVVLSRVLGLALASCAVLAGDVRARTPDALQCQSKVWKVVADVGPSCHGYAFDRICSGAAVGQARSRAERILAKRQAVAPPDACIPYLCAAGDTPYVCADKLVTGFGASQPDPLDDWLASDFRCLRRSARLLGKLAKGVRRCDGDGACVDGLVASYTTKLEQAVGAFVDSGASAPRCILGGCGPDSDVSPCVRAAVSGAAEAPPPPDPGGGGPPPGGQPPGDLTPEEAECLADSAIVLAEFDARVAKCQADADDVAACILEAREKREAKVAGLLDDASVRPEVCFPGVCVAGQTPEACAFTVFEARAPGSGEPPPGGGNPDPTAACRLAARHILDTLLDDVEDCNVTKSEDPSFDLEACIQAATEQQRTRLLAHLQAQLEDGIPPDDCLPVLCAEADDDVAACADAAIASTLGGGSAP